MEYIEIELIFKSENYDKVVDVLNNEKIETFMEQSTELFEEIENSQINWNYLEDNLIDVDEGSTKILAYLNNDEDGKKSLERMKKTLENFVEISTKIIKDEDWANNWKTYYKPFELDEVAIVPSWEEYSTDKTIVKIDPGMAFGTGTHETTTLCLNALTKYLKEGDIIYDIGCGSGILGIASLLRGASSAIAVDIDPIAIDATFENAKLNGVEDRIKIYKGNLLDVVSGSGNIIVSNIIAEIIVKMIGDLKDHLLPEGYFITSGIIEKRVKLVEDALIENGFTILEKGQMGEWCLIVAQR